MVWRAGETWPHPAATRRLAGAAWRHLGRRAGAAHWADAAGRGWLVRPDLLPQPVAGMPPVVFGWREDGLDPGGADPGSVDAWLRIIREARLFWPVPRHDAVAIETLLVAGDEGAAVTALERLAGRPRTGLLAASPGGVAAEAARRHGISVFDDAANLDPAALSRVVGPAAAQAVLLHAALGDIPVETFEGAPVPVSAARAWLGSARAIDPWFREPVTMEEGLDAVRLLGRSVAANRRPAMTVGLSSWKHGVVSPFLAGPSGPPGRHATVEAALAAAAPDGRVAIWGAIDHPGAEASCGAAGVPVVRLEDGFLRSVGLGLQRVPSASLVVEELALHFDARSPNGFEALIAAAEFPARLLERSVALRQAIVGARLTKYNVGRPAVLPDAAGRRRVLVPGQVEGDQSLRFGAPGIRTNAALLTAARRRQPDAFLLFKPHPDVLTGLRPGAVPPELVAATVDRVETTAGMPDCLDWADHVETMTSLTGFEALLRGRSVTVHGLPFYAGWGLTEDLIPAPGRRRRLDLDELVAAALLLYPRYVDPETFLPAPAEVVVRRLAERRLRVPTAAERALDLWRRALSFVIHRVIEPFERRQP